MQKHGYTFPVLEGASYKQALDLVPRTWIIDKQGSWRYVRDGFDDEKTYVEFEADLLAQLRKVNGEHEQNRHRLLCHDTVPETRRGQLRKRSLQAKICV